MEVANTDTTKLNTVGIHTASLLKTENCGNSMELNLNFKLNNWIGILNWMKLIHDIFLIQFFGVFYPGLRTWRAENLSSPRHWNPKIRATGVRDHLAPMTDPWFHDVFHGILRCWYIWCAMDPIFYHQYIYHTYIMDHMFHGLMLAYIP